MSELLLGCDDDDDDYDYHNHFHFNFHFHCCDELCCDEIKLLLVLFVYLFLYKRLN